MSLTRSSAVTGQDKTPSSGSGAGKSGLTVLDQSGTPIPTAVAGVDGGFPNSADSGGTIQFPGLTPGSHKFVITTPDGRGLTQIIIVPATGLSQTVYLGKSPTAAPAGATGPVGPDLALSGPSGATGASGATYTYDWTASGGTPPYSLDLAAGATPSSATTAGPVGADGYEVAGTWAAGPLAFAWVVRATDAAGAVALAPFAATVPGGPAYHDVTGATYWYSANWYGNAPAADSSYTFSGGQWVGGSYGAIPGGTGLASFDTGFVAWLDACTTIRLTLTPANSFTQGQASSPGDWYLSLNNQSTPPNSPATGTVFTSGTDFVFEGIPANALFIGSGTYRGLIVFDDTAGPGLNIYSSTNKTLWTIKKIEGQSATPPPF